MVSAWLFSLFIFSKWNCAEDVRLLAAHIGSGSSTPGAEQGPRHILTPQITYELSVLGFDETSVREIFEDTSLQLKVSHDVLGALELLSPLTKIGRWVRHHRRSRRLPIVIGGDHSISIASALGSNSIARSQGSRMALVWLDAHSDQYYWPGRVNFAHAIAIDSIVGEGPKAFLPLAHGNAHFLLEDIFFIGTRDSGAFEMASSPFRRQLLSPEEIQDYSEAEIYHWLDKRLAAYDEIHLSFDIDVVDFRHLQGFGHPLENGLHPEDILLLIRYFAQSTKLKSVDFAELNPDHDEHGQTAEFIRRALIELIRLRPH